MFKKQCFLKIRNFSTFFVSKQHKINLEMLRIRDGKVTILLLSAKTLAERCPNINKIGEAAFEEFSFRGVDSCFCATALLSFLSQFKRPSTEPGLAIFSRGVA